MRQDRLKRNAVIETLVLQLLLLLVLPIWLRRADVVDLRVRPVRTRPLPRDSDNTSPHIRQRGRTVEAIHMIKGDEKWGLTISQDK